ncbi:MAG: sodium:solute symporter [Bdellovibrionales bacterium]
MIDAATGLLILIGFIAVMAATSWITRPRQHDFEDFVVMRRQLGPWAGAASIAVSWIWAPAVFICSMKAYTQGLAGLFWFTVPNILCFFLFIPLALRLKKIHADGYSFPDFLATRYADAPHLRSVALIVYAGYQLGAIIINTLAGGTLFAHVANMDVTLAILLMATGTLGYSLISGLRASVMTDKLQMLMLLFIAFLIVPWVVHVAGGWSIISEGIGGQSGSFGNVLNPEVILGFGIASALSLLSGPLADQMFFQRAHAAKQQSIKAIFGLGGLLFGVVPIVLGILGFIAASPAVQNTLVIGDPQMVGPEVVAYFLPEWALYGFIILALAGLTSTLDSAYVALPSLFARSGPAHETDTVRKMRRIMIAGAAIGTVVALMQPKLLWVFLIYGALASCMLIPAFFAVFSSRVTGRALTWAIAIGIVGALPLSIYANVTEQSDLILLAALVPPTVGLAVCGASHIRNADSRPLPA